MATQLFLFSYLRLCLIFLLYKGLQFTSIDIIVIKISLLCYILTLLFKQNLSFMVLNNGLQYLQFRAAIAQILYTITPLILYRLFYFIQDIL